MSLKLMQQPKSRDEFCLDMHMKATLRLLKLNEIVAVDGIELDERDEDLAGGSMETVFERLRRRSDTQAHHPFLVAVESKTVGFLMPREGGRRRPGRIRTRSASTTSALASKLQGRGYGTAALVLAALSQTRKRLAIGAPTRSSGGDDFELFGYGRVRIVGKPRLSFAHHVDHLDTR